MVGLEGGASAEGLKCTSGLIEQGLILHIKRRMCSVRERETETEREGGREPRWGNKREVHAVIGIDPKVGMGMGNLLFPAFSFYQVMLDRATLIIYSFHSDIEL